MTSEEILSNMFKTVDDIRYGNRPRPLYKWSDGIYRIIPQPEPRLDLLDFGQLEWIDPYPEDDRLMKARDWYDAQIINAWCLPKDILS
jgi:hypothetical protein